MAKKPSQTVSFTKLSPTLMALLAERVKDAVPLRMAASWLGFDYPERSTGRHACPSCHQPGERNKDTLALYRDNPGDRWHCFRCGMGGDVIDWVAARMACSKGDALRRLAAEAGLSATMDDAIEAIKFALGKRGAAHQEGERAATQRMTRRLFWQARGNGALGHMYQAGRFDEYLGWLAAYWRAETCEDWKAGLAWCERATELLCQKHRSYLKPPVLAPGLARAALQQLTHDYMANLDQLDPSDGAYKWLDERNLESADSRHFYGFGWVNYRATPSVLERDAGLETANGNHLLNGRLVLPIAGLDGQVCAMAGRACNWTKTAKFPKWLNTAESVIFRKREMLYGLGAAHLACSQGYIALTEGYLDSIALTKVQVPGMALMGTALSTMQAELLRRMVPKVVLCMDNDKAGIEAMEDISLMLPGVEVVKFGGLADGKDPGDYLAGPIETGKYYTSRRQSLNELAKNIRHAASLDREPHNKTAELIKAKLEKWKVW